MCKNEMLKYILDALSDAPPETVEEIYWFLRDEGL